MAVAKAKYDLVAKDKSKKAFSSIRKSLGGLKGAIGGLGVAFGAAGFARFIKGSLNAGDQIQKLSIRLGASTEFLSEMKGVTELSGVTFQSFTVGIQRMTRRIAEAALGTGTAKDALKELGLNAQELNALPMEDKFLRIADALGGVTNDADRVRLAMKLFDTEGVSLVQTMTEGAAGIQKMRAQQVLMGNSLSRDMVDKMADANDAMALLGQRARALGSRFAVEFADPITEGAAVLGDVLIPVLKFAGNIFSFLGNIIGAVGAGLAQFFTGDFAGAARTAQVALADLKAGFKALGEEQKKAGLTPGPGGTPAVDALSGRVSGTLRAGGKTVTEDPQIKDTNKILTKIAKNTERTGFAIAG